MRKTKYVKAILHKFEQTKGAISVVDLIEGLHQEMNKTTVYRIMERLENDGLFHSFRGKDGRRWYAKCKEGVPSSNTPTNMHPHFHCKECGKVECFPFEIEIPILPDHEVDTAELLLVGKCANCSSK